jgi:hypothetical protein
MNDTPPSPDDAEVEFLREEHGPIVDDLLDIFLRHDPIMLGETEDVAAYLPEVEALLARLPEAASEEDVRSLVHDEIQRRVDEMAGPEMTYDAIAREVFAAWTRRRRD